MKDDSQQEIDFYQELKIDLTGKSDIQKKNFKILYDYTKFRSGGSKTRLITIDTQNRSILIPYVHFLNNTQIRKPTEDIIINFLHRNKKNSDEEIGIRTQITNLRVLKTFYRWLFNLDKTDKLPNFIKRIELKEPSDEELEQQHRERIISPEEYEKLLIAASNPRDKAILETFWLFGIRREELVSMRATDYIDKGKIRQITVRESKTKPRDVITQRDTPFLDDYVNNWQLYKNQKDKPLFISLSNKTYGQELIVGSVTELIKRLGKKAGLDKIITPHDFRHSYISRQRAKGTPDTHICNNVGLVKSSKMFSIYDHNGTKEFEEYLLNNEEIIEQIPRKQLEKMYTDKLTTQQDKINLLETKIDTMKDRDKNIHDLKESKIRNETSIKLMQQQINAMSKNILLLRNALTQKGFIIVEEDIPNSDEHGLPYKS